MKYFLAAVFLFSSSTHYAGEIKTLRHWEGKMSEGKAGKVKPGDPVAPWAPPSVPERVAKDAKTWESVWKRLRGKEPVANVDFTKELVLIATINTRDRIYIQDIQLDENGVLSYTSVSTKEGGNGFGYCLVVIPSAGVKTERRR